MENKNNKHLNEWTDFTQGSLLRVAAPVVKSAIQGGIRVYKAFKQDSGTVSRTERGNQALNGSLRINPFGELVRGGTKQGNNQYTPFGKWFRENSTYMRQENGMYVAQNSTISDMIDYAKNGAENRTFNYSKNVNLSTLGLKGNTTDIIWLGNDTHLTFIYDVNNCSIIVGKTANAFESEILKAYSEFLKSNPGWACGGSNGSGSLYESISRELNLGIKRIIREQQAQQQMQQPQPQQVQPTQNAQTVQQPKQQQAQQQMQQPQPQQAQQNQQQQAAQVPQNGNAVKQQQKGYGQQAPKGALFEEELNRLIKKTVKEELRKIK